VEEGAPQKPHLEAALDYLQLGWSVIPAHTAGPDRSCSCGRDHCASPGKHPRIKWAAYQERLPTEEEVQRWWRRWPEANIAVVTGKVSGIVVLDVDPRHGGDESLRDLGGLPDTTTAITGGGGLHLVFAHPRREIPNRASIWPGIDLRGDGGYIIAPPSQHESGRRYEWEVGRSPWEMAPAPLPQSVLERAVSGIPSLGEAAEPPFDLDAVLQRGVREGERNVMMTRIAGHLLGIGKDPLEVAQACLTINRLHFQPPLDDAEVWKVVRSIWQRETRKREALALAQKEDVPADELGPQDRQLLQAQAWRQLGLNGYEAIDTICYRMGETVQYKLVLSDGTTVPLGDDLLSQAQVRKAIANHLHIVLPQRKAQEWWALMRPILATVRDEEALPPPKEQVEDWLYWFCSETPPLEYEDPDTRHEAFRSGQPVLYGGYLWLKPSRLYQYIDARLAMRLPYDRFIRYLREAGFEPAWLWTGGGRTDYRHLRGWRRPWQPEVQS